MPLSQPAARERLHTRAIEINGYRRTDGLYDIEAHLTDCKSFGQTNYDRGYIEAGDPIHDMWLRLTVDEKMHIHGGRGGQRQDAVRDVSDRRAELRPAGRHADQGRVPARGDPQGRWHGRLHPSARTSAADGHDRLPDHQPGQGSAGHGSRGRPVRKARQRRPRQAHHREMGRREQDPEHLSGV